MRNRITWKGFGDWLNRQKNSREFKANTCDGCPVAEYITSVFHGKGSAAVASRNGKITDFYYKNTGMQAVAVSAPSIFVAFINKVDKYGVTYPSNRPNKVSAREAKEAYKIVNAERGIV